MGFWNGFGRILQGKPVFEASDDHSGWNDPDNDRPIVKVEDDSEKGHQHDESGVPVDEHGNKIIPIIRLEHCKSHINGTLLEVTIWSTNTSEYEIELESIVVAGVTTHLDRRRLAPGQGHDIWIYNGAVPRHTDHQMASLYYRMVKTDDNFKADFMIKYGYQADGSYIIEELHPENSVHDI